MAEFKRLSDVEVIAEPSESANVLIEENGVIKKAPKTAVGGAGGGMTEPDLVITSYNGLSSYTTTESLSIVSGSIANVKQAIMESRMPLIKFYYADFRNPSYAGECIEVNCSCSWYGSNLTITTQPNARGWLNIDCNFDSESFTYVSHNTL